MFRFIPSTVSVGASSVPSIQATIEGDTTFSSVTDENSEVPQFIVILFLLVWFVEEVPPSVELIPDVGDYLLDSTLWELRH